MAHLNIRNYTVPTVHFTYMGHRRAHLAFTQAPFGFTVAGDWLAACGKGTQAKTFAVQSAQTFGTAINPYFRQMLNLDCGSHTWVVAVGRGKFAVPPIKPFQNW